MGLAVVKELRSELDLSLEALAHDIEISASQLSRYENGLRDPSLSDLQKLARRFGVPVAKIIGEPAPVIVPVVSWVSAGRLQASHPVFERDVLRRITVADLPPGDWIALEVDGDSMDRIAPDGSTILTDRSDTEPRDGRYYVVSSDAGEATFKRYRSNPDRLQPFSTNPDHETHYITNSMTVVGRVRRVITDLR